MAHAPQPLQLVQALQLLQLLQALQLPPPVQLEQLVTPQLEQLLTEQLEQLELLQLVQPLQLVQLLQSLQLAQLPQLHGGALQLEQLEVQLEQESQLDPRISDGADPCPCGREKGDGPASETRP